MNEAAAASRPEFIIAVTGHAEVDCVPILLRRVLPEWACGAQIEKVRRVPQRPRLRIRGRKGGQLIEGMDDHQRLVREVPKLLGGGKARFFVWIDDLESGEDRQNPQPHFNYYRELMDGGIHEPLRSRCSIHFLANMLEAYFLADTAAVNQVDISPSGQSGQPQFLSLADHSGDCESIKNPKAVLKDAVNQECPTSKFDEIAHGHAIVRKLNLDHILSNPQTCRALRTLVAWCWEAIGEPRSDKFRLTDGVYWDITAGQLSDLPSVERIGPLAAEESYQPLQN